MAAHPLVAAAILGDVPAVEVEMTDNPRLIHVMRALAQAVIHDHYEVFDRILTPHPGRIPTRELKDAFELPERQRYADRYYLDPALIRIAALTYAANHRPDHFLEIYQRIRVAHSGPALGLHMTVANLLSQNRAYTLFRAALQYGASLDLLTCASVIRMHEREESAWLFRSLTREALHRLPAVVVDRERRRRRRLDVALVAALPANLVRYVAGRL